MFEVFNENQVYTYLTDYLEKDSIQLFKYEIVWFLVYFCFIHGSFIGKQIIWKLIPFFVSFKYSSRKARMSSTEHKFLALCRRVKGAKNETKSYFYAFIWIFR